MNKKANSGPAQTADYDYDVDIQSCSTMDCTGLIPTLPQSEEEIEHYNQLYPFLPEHIHDPED